MALSRLYHCLPCDHPSLQVLEKFYPWSPDIVEVFSRRGALFYALGMYDACIEDCLACLDLDPLYSAVRDNHDVVL